MDKQNARRIMDYLTNKVANQPDPRAMGKPLKGEFGQLWRYRVGDYRILCEIRDHELLVIAALIGHRRNIYT
jgi:mRNA interferase RelE/StbE